VKIWSLQALRFWAAFAVVLFHAYTCTIQTVHEFGVLGEGAALFGRVGVDVFFVLSGVIITLTSQGLTAGAFIARRAQRILPLYLPLAIFYLVGHDLMVGSVDWRQTFTSLTLWPALDRMVPPALPVAWTLCFEVLFYTAAALVIWRPKLIWALLALFVTALCLRSSPLLRFIGNPIILEFLMGVGLARLPRWRGAIWLIPVGLAATWLLGPMVYPLGPSIVDFLNGDMAWGRVLGLGLPAALIVWGTLQIEAREGVQTRLGDASYALYLIHLPIVGLISLALCRVRGLPPDIIVLTAAAASVALAWRAHVLFEKPMLAWARRPAFRLKAA
jgi:exopolysaccharide production protein ExoZ